MSNTAMMLYARKTDDDRLQTLRDHCQQVANEASNTGRRIELENLLRLCGLLHDLGKASEPFQRYLQAGEKARRGSVTHAAHGAVFARNRWRNGGTISKLTVDLIAVAICAHHGKLPDLISSEGTAYLDENLKPTRFQAPEERASEPMPQFLPLYFEQVASEAELDALFADAKLEVKQVWKERITPVVNDFKTRNGMKASNVRNGMLGLLQRDIFSALMDADRLDAYRFEAGDEAETSAQPPWDEWMANLECKIAKFEQKSAIERLRSDISTECLSHAQEGAGIYRLCVPTGGGKTFSAMRYALAAAKAQGMRRIVYAAPYKAILEQTADELRAALKREELILEHHSDVTFAKEDENGNRDARQEAEALKRYQYLTQRWDSPMVLTTTVQLLNALFAGNSASVRRFSALAGSVIILDEAQCVPIRCWYLLMNAIRYLTAVGGCAVVLCTATLPPWENLRDYPLPTPKPLIADEQKLHEAFRRVQLVDRTGEGQISTQQLAVEVLDARGSAKSALCILNTKKTALELHAAMKGRMPDDVPLYCLTTYQCPAHRAQIIQTLRARLTDKLAAVCVATQLIEAGVDVSFGLTVRALAGLESVTQAAGRCNRHAEREGGGLGEVWLVEVEGENLNQLEEIKQAQSRTRCMLRPMQASNNPQLNDLLSPAVLRAYFDTLIEEQNECMYYPIGSKHRQEENSLFGLLCSADDRRNAYDDRHKEPYESELAQAFRTAGDLFAPIEDATTPVLVPYGKGAALVEALRTERDVKTLHQLLREAQPYCVGVFKHDLDALQANHALTCRDDVEVWLLDPAYYRDDLGLTTERQALPFYNN